MAILPIQIARVSNLLQSNVADQAINGTQAQLLQVQNELDTGKQVNQPSDNPSAAATILSLQRVLSQQQSYSDNINNAQTQLSQVNSVLTQLNSLLTQATNTASSDAGSLATAQQRTGDAQVVNSLISEAQSLANTQLNGVYVFGGANGNQPPYVSANGGIQFVGSTNLIQNDVDQNVLMPAQVSAANVFGALSSRVTGSAMSAPSVTAQTQLSSLGGATNDGVDLGTIQLSNGTTSQTIDLSSAQTLGDVVSAINSAGVGSITASLTTSGIQLTGGVSDNITVTDVSGSAAADLGIATSPGGAGTGVPVTGAALNPKLTDFTPISTLNGGTGLDSAGIIITNGGQSKTITFPSGGDVQSILDAINGAGLGVQAQINSTGTGINVLNATQGTTLTIGENGGTTATELGIRSFSSSSDLSELNNGQGVGTAPAGSTADFSITNTSGTSFSVSIAGATTVQDVLNDINSASTAAGANVTASFATTGNGIVLTDSSGGTANSLSVQPEFGSTAAADLGLTTPASSSATTITGADVDGVQTSGIFTDLQALSTALSNNDPSAITAAAQNLQNDYNNVTDAAGVAGAQAQDLENRSSALQSQNIATQTVLSNVQDTNMTTAISEFQTLQTALQAALETTVTSQSLSLLNYL
jgi:flagellar hook-associated protein 3 FlgL